MGKETYQITEYVHDQVVAHYIAFGLIGSTELKEDKNDLIDFCELESFNPPDTISSRNIFSGKNLHKKIDYYVRSFPEEPFKADHQEGNVLFSIMWIDSDNYWSGFPCYCFSA